MIFGEKSIEGILSGKKTMTRRLVKEGEELMSTKRNILGSVLPYSELYNRTWYFDCVQKNGRVKWQVGNDYAVCPGRGKRGLLYCPKCYSISAYSKEVWCAIKKNHKEEIKMKPLRVVIKSIRKEKLLDISEADAKKEGYKNCVEFVEAFAYINRKSLPTEIKKLNGMLVPSLKKLEMWNPFVWVLEFEVLK